MSTDHQAITEAVDAAEAHAENGASVSARIHLLKARALIDSALNTSTGTLEEAAHDLFDALIAEARGWAGDDADDLAVLKRVKEQPAAEALDGLAHSHLLPSKLCGAVIDALLVMDPDTYNPTTSPVPDKQLSESERKPERDTDTEASTRDCAAALRPLLDAHGPEVLTAIGMPVAGAEEAAWRNLVARRVRAIAPGPYAVAVFTAKSKLSMGHADYSARNVELYAEAEVEDQDEPNETLDFDDATLARALGALAELLRPSDGAELEVDLDQEDEGN